MKFSGPINSASSLCLLEFPWPQVKQVRLHGPCTADKVHHYTGNGHNLLRLLHLPSIIRLMATAIQTPANHTTLSPHWFSRNPSIVSLTQTVLPIHRHGHSNQEDALAPQTESIISLDILELPVTHWECLESHHDHTCSPALHYLPGTSYPAVFPDA